MTTFRVTLHAARRFQERVRPTLTVEQAQQELLRLLDTYGELVEWEPREGVSGDHCYEIADGIWVPCAIDARGRVSATTVITADWLPDEIRERRNSKRARRKSKQARDIARRHEGKRGASMRARARGRVE